MADVPSNVDPATKSFLGKEMYLVVTRPVRSPEIAKRLADHLAHQIEIRRHLRSVKRPLEALDSGVLDHRSVECFL